MTLQATDMTFYFLNFEHETVEIVELRIFGGCAVVKGRKGNMRAAKRQGHRLRTEGLHWRQGHVCRENRQPGQDRKHQVVQKKFVVQGKPAPIGAGFYVFKEFLEGFLFGFTMINKL